MEENKVDTNVKTEVVSKPTSFIPQKGYMEPLREKKAELPLIAIEATHIVIFLVILAALFLPNWLKNKKF